MSHAPGGSYTGTFTTQRADTSEASDADSLPVATVYRNGTAGGTSPTGWSSTLIVTNITTGVYKVTGTIPSGYTVGDLVQIVVNAEVNSISGNLTVGDFMVDNTADDVDAILEDTSTTLPAQIEAAGPQTHSCDSVTATTGTVVTGTHSSTHTDNGTYYQVAPVTPAVGGFGLNQSFTFTIGVGRLPNAINVNGYFAAAPPNPTDRAVEVWAWDYTIGEWESISDSDNHMDDETGDHDYQYALNGSHFQVSDGEVKVRFTSTSTNINDDLYLDHLVLTSVVQAAAGLTADAISNAVWQHDITEHTSPCAAGAILYLGTTVFCGNVTTGNTSSSFTVSTLPAVADLYNDYVITVHDEVNGVAESAIISDMSNAGVLTLSRALSFTPSTVDHVSIKPTSSSPYLVDILEDTGTTIPGTITTTQADITAIKAVTDVIPNSGALTDIASNVSDIITDTGTTIPNAIAVAQADLDIITGTYGALLDRGVIAASTFDESTAFPVKFADAGSTLIARSGADGDTLKDLSDQSDDLETQTDFTEWDLNK